MKHDEFEINLTFYTAEKKWRCTDVGRRTITAIIIDDRKDQSWFNGPPYAVSEYSFDENDFEGCSLEPMAL